MAVVVDPSSLVIVVSTVLVKTSLNVDWIRSFSFTESTS